MSKSRLMRRKLAVVAAIGVVLAGSAAPVSASAIADGPTGPLAGEMRRLLKLQPGGVQVSDNALVWEATGTVVVWPSPGERVAPKGLGSNVRRDAARRMGVEPLTENSIQDVYGCPSGITVKDYYCFYTDINFGGRRLQFTGATGSGYASSWGFDNQTSSWVNTDSDVTIHAYDATTGTGWLWDEPENARVSYVGDTKNDRMSWWTT
ncbi:peptidase inhibitor family I36 protein [Kribbella sindirgiensis]|uniref:Uncharacterized protein n=1 Tax=Kribbella sindirgiensis TaxID=1124744 RepID=A0A4R0JF18_9ACTN|nr:peptidase inhibitor family I36 protein [Kribbella sindirgiensis]TCC43206.1 hypothetical protein E0H50_01595 [Kribbella sindirgiensis]